MLAAAPVSEATAPPPPVRRSWLPKSSVVDLSPCKLTHRSGSNCPAIEILAPAGTRCDMGSSDCEFRRAHQICSVSGQGFFPTFFFLPKARNRPPPRTHPHPQEPKHLDEVRLRAVRKVYAFGSPQPDKPSCPKYWPKFTTYRIEITARSVYGGRIHSARGKPRPSV